MESQDQPQPGDGAKAIESHATPSLTLQMAQNQIPGTPLAATLLRNCGDPSMTFSNGIAISSQPLPSSAKKAMDSKESRQPFPAKVYDMLQDADARNFSQIVSWNATGDGFMVHDKDHFTAEIVPRYFNLTKYKSFQRQLSLYGFQRVTVGPNKGLRYHEKLKKGEVDLVRQMKPVGYKPRNLARVLEQQKKKHHEQQQQQEHQNLQELDPGMPAANITTTTTTTVVRMTTTSTTTVSNNAVNNNITSTPIPSGTVSSSTGIDSFVPRDASMSSDGPLDKVISMLPKATILPVVSSNSIMKPEDQEASSNTSQGKQIGQMLERQNNHIYTVSPETTYRNQIQLPNNVAGPSSIESAGQSTVLTQVSPPSFRQQTGSYVLQDSGGIRPSKIVFEGKMFFLMPPTRELGINVKLELLKEFNPESSLLQMASRYVTPGYTTEPIVTTTTVPTTIPLMPTIDAVHPDRPSLLEPFTDLIGATGSATSTASAIAALHTAAAAAAVTSNGTTSVATATNVPTLVPSNPRSDVALETRSTDPLDFHSINGSATTPTPI